MELNLLPNFIGLLIYFLGYLSLRMKCVHNKIVVQHYEITSPLIFMTVRICFFVVIDQLPFHFLSRFMMIMLFDPNISNRSPSGLFPQLSRKKWNEQIGIIKYFHELIPTWFVISYDEIKTKEGLKNFDPYIFLVHLYPVRYLRNHHHDNKVNF